MKKSNTIVLATILIVYFLLSLLYSSKQGFWHDEIHTLTFLKGVSVYPFEGSVWSQEESELETNFFKKVLAEDNYYNNFATLILHEGHPPLYFILLKLWSYAFGCSEVALRSFSTFCGVISILLLFNLFRKKSKKSNSAWLILAMLLFNPFLFYFFNEARMYSLSFLFATLSFKYWMAYQSKKILRSKEFLLFCLSSICLLHTHYYGLFFLTTIAIVELLKDGFRSTILYHGIAGIFFMPWIIVIHNQLSIHEVHWTDGIIPIGESAIGYISGITELLISPMSAPLTYEIYIISIHFLFITINLILKKWKFSLILIFAILVYGIQVYLFDQVVGHHTIMISRYYIFSLILIYWGVHKLLDESNYTISYIIPILYTVTSSTVLFQVFELQRAPKQMYREVAGYLDSRFESETKIIVFEPKGPLIVGIAYYLQNNFTMIPAKTTNTQGDSSIVYIDEMLGLPYCENKHNNKEQEEMELVPFVAISLYK